MSAEMRRLRLALRLRVFLAFAAALAAGAAHGADDPAGKNPYPWIAAAYVVKRDGVLLWHGEVR